MEETYSLAQEWAFKNEEKAPPDWKGRECLEIAVLPQGFAVTKLDKTTKPMARSVEDMLICGLSDEGIRVIENKIREAVRRLEVWERLEPRRIRPAIKRALYEMEIERAEIVSFADYSLN